jgi:hypothetical protein
MRTTEFTAESFALTVQLFLATLTIIILNN